MESVTQITDAKARRSRKADPPAAADSEKKFTTGADDPGFTDGPDNPNIRKPEDFPSDEPEAPKKRGRKKAETLEALDGSNGAADTAGESTEESALILTDETEAALADPHLFEEMDAVRIPKLEALAYKLAETRDKKKALTATEKDQADECYRIMNDYGIEIYNQSGIHLKLTKDPKIKVEIDGPPE